MPEIPKLTSLSSARSISEDQISSELPTTMTYDQPIIIRAPPKTNFWRKPPNIDDHNAATQLISTPIDIHRFHSARVTVSADWNTLYDQGGLILFFPEGDPTTWLKTGLELVKEKLTAMSVDANPWSDVALVPLEKEKGGKMTIQVEREVEEGKKLDGLHIFTVDGTGKKEAIRLDTSWFTHKIPNQKLLIGVYAGRPEVPEGEGRKDEELVVTFEGFEVKLFDE